MKPSENVGKIKGLVNGYKSTYILISAAKIGIFDILSKESLSAQAVAEKLGYEERKIEPVLNALVHFGLIDKNDEIYSMDEYRDVLDPASPLCQLGYINHAINMADKWRNLESVIKQPTDSEENFKSITGSNYAETKAFLQAMNTNAIPQAKFLTQNYQFENHKFIDIGAGYGTYAIEIAKSFDKVNGVAFDLPVAAQIIEENVQSLGVSDKICVMPGNYKENLPTEKFDDALLFAIIHQEPINEAKKLIQNVYGLLTDGGKLYLTSFFLDDTKTGPAFSVLFGVEMLVGSEEGRAYSHKEICEILTDVGFRNIKCVHEMPGPATLYIAEK